MSQEAPRNQKKIQCWVSLETWDKIVSLGYDSPTIAVTKAFEKLIESSLEDPNGNTTISQEDPIEPHEDPRNIPEIPSYQARIEELQIRNETERAYMKKEIERLTIALQEAPDPVELAEIRGHFEGLKLVLQEKDQRLEELNRHIEDISPFANYYKTKELKQIEGPAVEKKSILSRLKFW